MRRKLDKLIINYVAFTMWMKEKNYKANIFIFKLKGINIFLEH